MSKNRPKWWNPTRWLGGSDVEAERDLGLSLVQLMRQKLHVDDKWIVERSHGFRWWPADFEQEVWAEEVETGVGLIAHNLWIRTELLRVPASQLAGLHAPVLSFAHLATLSGFEMRRVSSDMVLSLVSSVAVHPQTRKVLSGLAVDAAVVQLSEAIMMRDLSTDLLAGEGVRVSSHPISGVRQSPDEMCQASEKVLRPLGARPSHCSPKVLADVAEGVYRLYEMRPAKLDANLLCYRLGDHGRELKLMVNPSAHPLWGFGALVTLETNKPVERNDRFEAILSAQALEAEASMLPIHRIGSWCVSPEGCLSFAAFLPNGTFGSADPLLQVVATQFIRARLTV